MVENAWSFRRIDRVFCSGRGRLDASNSFAVRGAVRRSPPRSWCCMTAKGPRGGSLGGRVDTNNLMLWEKFFRDPTFWWDNRFNKRNKYFPDFKHVSTGESLWIADRKTPTWVSAKLESLADTVAGKATTARYKFSQASPVAGDNPVSLGRLIRDSAESRCLFFGKQAHEAVLKSVEHKSNVYLLNGLMDMYCKCGVLEEARKIFDSMGTRDSVSYNVIIHGCGLNGQAELALEYYFALRAYTTIQPDDWTHVSVISACSTLATKSSEKRERALRIGMEIHSMLSKEKKQLGLFVANCLVDMYCKCGQLEEARKIFDSMGTRDSVSYTAFINGCNSNGQAELALEYYSALRADTTIQPDDRTHVSVISACSTLAAESSEKRERALRIGMEIHSMLSKEKKQLDLFVATCLVDMYCKCGKLEEACKIFNSMGTRDSVSYNVIIHGCGSNGQAELALEYYSALRADTTIQPDDRTHVSVISACSTLATESSEKREKVLCIGMGIHSMLSKEKKQLDLFVANCLVDMYCKCGELEEACKIFDSMGTRDSVSYTAIINGCNSNGQAEIALEYYSALEADNTIQPDAFTYTCVLVACGTVMAIKLGREIHQLAKHKGLLKNDPVLASSLVSFYGKCGDVASAEEAFDECQARDDTGLWTSLIQAYTLQGRSIQALESFYSMTQEEGCKANDVTFVTVLNACGHGGLVDQGRQLLDEMPKQYGVEPRLEHYNCVIDMLGRANQLDEAMRVLRTMPFEPGAVAWASLLGACRKWKNYTIGKLAFERLVEIDPKNSMPYVLMANIFGNLGMLSEMDAVVERMRGERSIRKAGRSWWTDVSSGKVHSLTVGDRNHSQIDEIEAKLNKVLPTMKEEGYASDVIKVLQDIPEEEGGGPFFSAGGLNSSGGRGASEPGLEISSNLDLKDQMCGHSEKLVVACALLNSHQKETIRIVKNL